MRPVRKKKKDPVLALVQGFAAVSVTAALLGAALFLAVPRGSRALPTEPTQPVITRPVSRIPANPYGPDDFTYENGLLTCTAGKTVPGVDVSAHQGAIDWEQVRASGIRFAMIRLGYRGYRDGLLHVDEQVQQNLAGARAAGLRIGAYFFSQAINTEEAFYFTEYAVNFILETIFSFNIKTKHCISILIFMCCFNIENL